MKQLSKPGTVFLEGFRQLERTLTSEGPAWLRESRQAGLARFAKLGFPTTRQEAWRNTNVSPIADGRFGPAARGTLALDPLPALAALELGGPRVVLVDGQFDERLSRLEELPPGLQISTIGQLLALEPEALRGCWTRSATAEDGAFRALNAAFTQDGVLIRVAPRAIIEQPIHVAHISTAGATDAERHGTTHTRVWISLEAGSQATAIESYISVGQPTYLTNAVTEIELADGSVLHHDRVQLESENAYHIAHVATRQHANTSYTGRHFNLGGRLVRNELRGELCGEGGTCTMDGLYLTRGSQHIDNHTVLDHQRPHCDSRELFKGILLDRSRTVFNGRIIVRQEAQKTDAQQSNPNVLLSDASLAHTRPQLEIYADDVRCTHGATIGQLDGEAIFYLQSRGIPAEAARNLLTEAFAGEILERVAILPLRRLLEAEVTERLCGV